MKTKFAKAIAANIKTIAGNVAHVALIDAGLINDEVVRPYRSEACAAIEKAESNIAALLASPGAQTDAKD